MTEVMAEIKKDYIHNLIKNNKRIDGRLFDEYREIKIETGVISDANGSALVKIGDTQVIVGIKAEIGEPFPDTPEKGVLTTNVELVPLASPTFEPGPPDESSIEIARVVDRGIREGKMIDLESLCIIEGKKVWVIFVDIHVLDHDGNLIDASALGAVAALLNAKIPKFEVKNDEVLINEEELIPLPISSVPVYCTMVKIDDKIIVDPILDEEMVMSSRITFVSLENNVLCAMQKGENGTFKLEEVFAALENAKNKAPEVRAILRG